MAIIPQLSLFSWQDLEELGDLERLVLVLETVPDEALMAHLEAARGHGRNTYPVRAMWNSVLAGVVFQHPSIESLRRELARNAPRRMLCGFRTAAVPPASAYTRFLHRLMAEQDTVDEMFEQLVDDLAAVLPDFGQRLAMDSKGISSRAVRPAKHPTADGRRDVDADFGRKEYRGVHEDGTTWTKVVKWFGYKLHLVVDATYELPVAWEVTKASVSDVTRAMPLLDHLHHRHGVLLSRAVLLTADRGYDDTQWIAACWDTYQIKPVIDIRNMWRDPNATRVLPGHSTVTYNYRGDVFCQDPVTGQVHTMSNGGFEVRRQRLKKRCPARFAGVSCRGQDTCPVVQGLRIPLQTDRRIFTPMDRASYQWKREYAHRTAVERVNSRLDVSFGLELHTIRGLKKMHLRCGLALIVMLAMALGRIRQRQPERMRRLVG
ncbi:transposase [Sulfobacillus thermosulfidooxidans]|uniref:transposase n=1 Tax=Sulfobacillus thermosulfidooxidans TaxID=28034 RepID=UPI0004261FEF